jgi:Phage protein Gp138 N-terminal domain
MFRQQFPNPYDPTSNDQQPETLPLDEIIRQAIKAQLLDVNVALPGQVVAVLGNQKANIQPLLQSRYAADQSVVNIPVIQNVPIMMPLGQNYAIKLPVAVGDTGLLVFSDRSLDLWNQSNGGIIDPQDNRAHFLQDAVFIPGLVPFPNQTEDDTTDLVLANGDSDIRLLANGKVRIESKTQELINVLDQLLNVLINETFTLTMLGPEPFIASTITALTQVRTNLDTFLDTSE